MKVDRGWSRAFEDQIPLPRGRLLVTLKDAANYITRLPKAEHESPQWQAAIEALITAAEGRGPPMHARIGVMRAPNRHVERVFNPGCPKVQKVPDFGWCGRWDSNPHDVAIEGF